MTRDMFQRGCRIGVFHVTLWQTTDYCQRQYH